MNNYKFHTVPETVALYFRPRQATGILRFVVCNIRRNLFTSKSRQDLPKFVNNAKNVTKQRHCPGEYAANMRNAFRPIQKLQDKAISRSLLRVVGMEKMACLGFPTKIDLFYHCLTLGK